MAQQLINNGESGLIVRTKINENFTDVYSLIDSIPAGPEGPQGPQGPQGAPGSGGGPSLRLLLASGAYFTNQISGGALGTQSQAANSLRICPFQVNYGVTIDQVGVSVSTAVAASFVRVVVYDADEFGRPTTLLAQSGDIDASTAGTKLVSLSFTFVAGKRYWVGTHANGTCTLRAVSTASTLVLAVDTSATPSQRYNLLRTVTFGSADNWPAYANTQLSNTTPALVLMRVA